MEFTGERFITTVDGDIVLEHVHRYLVACELVKDKIVLDIASGSGYGSAMLSRVAKQVTGVDISAEAVCHAQSQYQADNLNFLVGQVTKIPLDSASVQVVVSFETIEHLTEHEVMLQEIKRVLCPGGLLIISSPDKYEYTDVPGCSNEYHVKELYKQEFSDLLQANFKYHCLTGQRVVYGSVIGSEQDSAPFLAWQQIETDSCSPKRQFNPLYFLALASDAPLPSLSCGLLQAPVEQSNLARQLQKELTQLQVSYYQLQDNYAQCDSQAQQLTQSLTHAQAELQLLQGSRSWRITAPLRSIGKYTRKLLKHPRVRRNLMRLYLLPAATFFYRKPTLSQLSQKKQLFTRVLFHKDLILKSLKENKSSAHTWAANYLNKAWDIHTEQVQAGEQSKFSYLTGVQVSLAELPTSTQPQVTTQSKVTTQPKVTIIVPVYNGLDHLKNLCACLFNSTDPNNTHYIFLNDASTDPQITPFLNDALQNQNQCQLIQHEYNQGFVKTVNEAIALVTTPYFVLLNTDVILPSNWLPRLLKPLTQDPRIASTTPFSNSAVFFSYPNFLQDNPLFNNLSLTQIDAAFAQLDSTPTLLNTIHSGVGFCMGMSKKIWDQLGSFDEIFAQGYGEENDWCMRASSQGFVHVLVPNLYVYHAHGGSFTSTEKTRLAAEHLEILKQRWPLALAQATWHSQTDPWQYYRALASLLLVAQPATLCIQPANAPQTAHQDLLLLANATDRTWELVSCQDLNNKIPLTHLDEIETLFQILPIQQVWVNYLDAYATLDQICQILPQLKTKYQFKLRSTQPQWLNQLPDSPELKHFLDSCDLLQYGATQTPDLLVIDFKFESGGAYSYREKWIKTWQEQGKTVLLLQYDLNKQWFLTWHSSQETIQFNYLPSLETIIQSLSIKEVFINNLVNCPLTEHILQTLLSLKADSKLQLSYVFHDYYSICPSNFLMTPALQFCGGGSPEICAVCAPHNPNFCIHHELITWRQIWSKFLSQADSLTCFSQSSAKIITRNYPQLNQLQIKEHELLTAFTTTYTPPPANAPLILGFLGDFCPIKGSSYLIELAQLIHVRNPANQLIAFGQHPPETYPHITYHGQYQRQDLPQLLSEAGIKAIILPSPCSETFSYIALECMNLNIPLICFDIGAPAERIRKYQYQLGAIASEFSAQSLLDTLDTLLAKVYT